ncbi:hypothetical protein DRJ22_00935 [Candidatus Woesearchaeota archaeon]|nr:MAG: hypothetical protein B6U93_02800 [Candidatus Woesearchaeota archaeon ex4484_78]RLE46814.1 MAG: hypothetical protein DRJ22_00935 [Candidatus Woesearchaeota archaeon]
MKKIIIFMFVFSIVFVTSSGFSGESTLYSVESTTQAQLGNLGSGQTYSARFTMTSTQQGNKHARSTSYLANIGWFRRLIPEVFPDKQLEGKSYLLNETALIKARMLDPDGIEITKATITKPNETKELKNLTNSTRETYETTFNDLLLRGTYKITYLASDIIGYTNNFETSYFKRRAFDQIDIITNETKFLNYSTSVVSDDRIKQNLSAKITGKRIKLINVSNHYKSSPYSVLVVEDDYPFENNSFTQYALDPKYINFTNMSFIVTAVGNKLYKCQNYSIDEQDCLDSNWTFVQNITSGQNYSVTISHEDPGFLEASISADVSLAPIDNETFVVAYVDSLLNDVAFKIMKANGTTQAGPVIVDSSVNVFSRVSVAAVNATHFVISWVDGPVNDLVYAIYSFEGNLSTGPTVLDTNIGTNTDVSVAELGDRFVVCDANDADNDADYRILFNNGTMAVGESRVDNNMNPRLPLQNLIECTGINNSRWTYFWFDYPSRDATYDVLTDSGSIVFGPSDIDPAVGRIAQVATTALDNDKFALGWYDSRDHDITISTVWKNGTVIAGPIDVDTNPGRISRLAIATIRENETTTPDLFVIAWWNRTGHKIMAAVYNSSGEVFTPAFEVESQPLPFTLMDVISRDPITQNTICPGYFIIAYTNSSLRGHFKGFNINGSVWDGLCKPKPDLIPINISFSNENPKELENITINATIFNNGKGKANNVKVRFYDGLCGYGSQINGDVVISQLNKGENFTVNVTWLASPVGPHNISVCVDPDNSISEINESNNNLSKKLNVKAYHTYFGKVKGNITLENLQNKTQAIWNATDDGNIYFTDSDEKIDFFNLQALGRNATGQASQNNFLYADVNLNMTNFNDSIQTLWAINATTPKKTTNFTIFGTTIENVPYYNTSNNFITGILWDKTKDTNGHYDTTDKETLVFVSKIHRNTQGKYGIYDYEIKVPALLRAYNHTTTQVKTYLELL